MPIRDIAGKLDTVENNLEDLVKKLTRINAEWADPPDPDRPSIRTSLAEIKTAAATAAALADQMLARL